MEELDKDEESIVREACGNKDIVEALNQLMNKKEAVRDLSGKSHEEIRDIVKEIITRNKDSISRVILGKKSTIKEIAEIEGLSTEEVVDRILDTVADAVSTVLYRKVQKVQKDS